MITFYQRGGGSSECETIKLALPPETWEKIRRTAVRLLKARGHDTAASILEHEGFDLFDATNGFRDDFLVLTKRAIVEDYAGYGEVALLEDTKLDFSRIASVLSELSFPIRFAVVELDTDDGINPVNAPITIAPVEVVKRALIDAEQLLVTSGPVSAIDRVHTALIGYLKWVCEQAGNLPVTTDPSITELFKAAGQHPKLSKSATHSEKIEKILRAFASAIDSVNQVRNRGSMAHANEDLVDDADAMLVVNAARTMLRYLDDRLK